MVQRESRTSGYGSIKKSTYLSPQNKYKTGKKFKKNNVRNLEIDQRQREIEVHLFVKNCKRFG